MRIAKIMVGVDFSAQSNEAIEQAVAIARKFEAEVVLVHAAEIPRPEPEGDELARLAARFEKILRDQLLEQRRLLARMPERLAAKGVRISQQSIVAPPDTGLPNAAAELGADLLVVGTHGRSGLGRLLMGSVAERAVRLSRTDVLIARGEAKRRGFRKLLVPIDFTALTEDVVDAAVSLADEGAQIDLFHAWDVWELPTLATRAGHPKADTWRGEMAESVRVMAEKLIERHRRTGAYEFAVRQAESSPAVAIHDRLAADGYDLVVIGSHGRRGLRRYVLGGVAELTVRHAPCSVYVVHAAARQKA